MLKNKYIKLASIMLMLCIITTCGVSGTFAKYTTEGTVTDSARVAKWGVTLDINSDNAFAASYGENVKSSSSSKKVVAPGTDGTLLDLSITGTPEVAVRYTVDVDLELSGWVYDTDKEHCPLVFTVYRKTALGGSYTKLQDVYIDGTLCKSVAELETALEKMVITALMLTDNSTEEGTGRKQIMDLPVSPIANPGNLIKVDWRWDIDITDDPSTPENEQYERNLLDTKIGTSATPPTVSFEIDLTIEQID